jgi:ribosomal protein L44E
MNPIYKAAKFIGDIIINDRTKHLPVQVTAYCDNCGKHTLHKLEYLEDVLLKKGVTEGDLGAIVFGAATKYLPCTKLGLALENSHCHNWYLCSECETTIAVSNLRKSFRRGRYRWSPVNYYATCGDLNRRNAEQDWIDQNEMLSQWIRKHIRYDKPSFFNDSPITVHQIRRFYENESDGVGLCGDLSKADMACALERYGFPAVGCYGDGWYFEVRIIK